MEVSYKRRFNQSYMILKHEEYSARTHDLAILAHNKISGFLPMDTEIADGTMCFWYEITGKQTLKDYLTRRQADCKLLYLLFEGIRKILEVVSDYLLDEKNILLQEEYIYIDFAQEELKFVYLPEWRKDSRTAFRELMEVVLQRLDYSDKTATAVAHEMYQGSLGQEESFLMMWKKTLKESFEGMNGELQEDRAIKSVAADGEETSQKVCIEWNEEPEINKKSRKQKKNSNWLKQKIKLKDRPEEEPLPLQPREEVSHPTEVLIGNKEMQGILIYQGVGTAASMRIDKSIFMIGKQEGEVDGYIDAKSVSRIHAKIEQVEGDYYIEDLNSTNGTYLNGELLEYHQKVKLQMRDRITFGIEEFIFL